MKFTERFNEVLQFGGKKQSEIAEYCKVSRQVITDYKKGKSFPSLETLFLLCQYLNVTSDYLLGLSDY